MQASAIDILLTLNSITELWFMCMELECTNLMQSEFLSKQPWIVCFWEHFGQATSDLLWVLISKLHMINSGGQELYTMKPLQEKQKSILTIQNCL